LLFARRYIIKQATAEMSSKAPKMIRKIQNSFFWSHIDST
jgi:hypothetical protein